MLWGALFVEARRELMLWEALFMGARGESWRLKRNWCCGGGEAPDGAGLRAPGGDTITSNVE